DFQQVIAQERLPSAQAHDVERAELAEHLAHLLRGELHAARQPPGVTHAAASVAAVAHQERAEGRPRYPAPAVLQHAQRIVVRLHATAAVASAGHFGLESSTSQRSIQATASLRPSLERARARRPYPSARSRKARMESGVISDLPRLSPIPSRTISRAFKRCSTVASGTASTGLAQAIASPIG